MATNKPSLLNKYNQLMSSSILVYFLLIGLLLSTCKEESSNRLKNNKSGSIDQSKGSFVISSFTAEDLRRASLKGQINVVHNAISKEIDINSTDVFGLTALMLASFNGHTEIVQLLLGHGARVSAQNSDGRSPLIFAASGPFPKTVEVLLECGADPNLTDQIEGWSALMFAASEGHSKVVQKLLDYDANKILADKEGETALDFARNNNHTEVIKILERAKDDN